MVRQSLPRVLDDQLILPDRADQSFLAIQVGSEELVFSCDTGGLIA
jgi:hypothetical protein